MDTIIAKLLSLHLGAQDEGAALRAWCQAEIDRDPEAFNGNVSQRLRGLAVLALVPKRLSDAYWDAALASSKRRRS